MGAGWFMAGRGWLVVVAVLAVILPAASPGAAQVATPVSDSQETNVPLDGSSSGQPGSAPGAETPVLEPTETPVLTDALPGDLPTGDDSRPGGSAPDGELGNQPMRLSVQSVSSDTDGVTCMQVSEGDDVLAAGEYVVFRCDNGDSTLLKTGNYPNYYLRVLSVTAGWRWSVVPSMTPPEGDPATNPAGWGSVSTSAGAMIWGGSAVTQAYIALGPDPATAVPGVGELAIEFLQGKNYQSRGAPYPNPRTATLGATYQEQVATCQPVAGSSAVAFDVSTRTPDGYPAASASVWISLDLVDDGACSGFPDSWTVQMSATAMAGPGGATIPPEAISYAGAAGGGVSPPGVTPVDSAVPLSLQPQTIAVGGADAETGSWEAVLVIAPPTASPPGDYAGTLIVDISASGG